MDHKDRKEALVQSGTGIDSERYYQAYVRKLRKTVILSLQGNGQNSVFFRPLRNILQEETNRVCKCGCDFDQDDYGMCTANFSPFYKPVPSPIYRTLTSRDRRLSTP